MELKTQVFQFWVDLQKLGFMMARAIVVEWIWCHKVMGSNLLMNVGSHLVCGEDVKICLGSKA